MADTGDGMGFWSWLLVASAPALAVLWIFWRRDRWEREPPAKVALLFGLGALAAGPAWLLEGWLPGPDSRLFDTFVRVALVEETCKLLPLLLFALRDRDLDEPMDGIVYAVAAALGFATVENALYAQGLGFGLLLQRVGTSMLAHVGFTGILGYAVGVAKTRPHGRAGLLARAFAGVVALHGAYDYGIAFGAGPGSPEGIARLTVALLVPLVLVLLFRRVNRACRTSPFRARQAGGEAGDADVSATRAGAPRAGAR